MDGGNEAEGKNEKERKEERKEKLVGDLRLACPHVHTHTSRLSLSLSLSLTLFHSLSHTHKINSETYNAAHEILNGMDD